MKPSVADFKQHIPQEAAYCEVMKQPWGKLGVKHSFIHLIPLYLTKDCGVGEWGLEPIPVGYWVKAGYTLKKVPVHHRLLNDHWRPTSTHISNLSSRRRFGEKTSLWIISRETQRRVGVPVCFSAAQQEHEAGLTNITQAYCTRHYLFMAKCNSSWILKGYAVIETWIMALFWWCALLREGFTVCNTWQTGAVNVTHSSLWACKAKNLYFKRDKPCDNNNRIERKLNNTSIYHSVHAAKHSKKH